MPGTFDSQGRKWDESDSAFQMEAAETETVKDYNVDQGRVFDVPTRHKSVSVGKGMTKSVAVCIHGRLVTHPCPTCEFEAPKLLEKGRT